MKRTLSGLDLIAVVKELQSLIGSRVDKVYQPEKDEIMISFTGKEAGKKRLHIKPIGWIWLSETSGEMPLSPTSFAMQLRKYVSNGIVESIVQRASDRIVEMTIRKNVDYRIIFELFGEGNILLVSEDKIIAPMKIRKWKHRDLKPNNSYSYPPEAFNPRAFDALDFEELVKNSKADIVRTLATRLNLGGVYAEEICKRAGLDKETPASEATDDQLEDIRSSILEIVEDMEEISFPHVSYENGQPVDVSPRRLESDEGRELKEFHSFSAAIDSYIVSLPRIEPEEAKMTDERGRVERTLSVQESAIADFRVEIDRAQKLAELIFSNYGQVEKILEAVKESIETGDLPDGVEIINQKEGGFVAKINDEITTLSWKKGVVENAQVYYDGVKRLRAKLEGAMEAIIETKKKIEKLEDEELIRKASLTKEKRKAKPAWFERYRWFLSSEGVLVIAGKDAKSNEQVVRKHLNQGDRYIHADIHGAPSVVSKAQEGMTEITLREAGIFSLAMSKAWNSGIGSGTAYWVTPEQVSKTAESGEFLPKGAFVIRGKRNYFERLDIELGIGICTIASKDKIMCGPIDAVAKNCRKFLKIEPGDISKEKAAKEFAERFSWDISEVQAVLPPGKIRIISDI